MEIIKNDTVNSLNNKTYVNNSDKEKVKTAHFHKPCSNQKIDLHNT